MTQTVTGLFDRYMDAAAAVRELEAAGIPHADISIVANNIVPVSCLSIVTTAHPMPLTMLARARLSGPLLAAAPAS
jgi:hypothetical protein